MTGGRGRLSRLPAHWPWMLAVGLLLLGSLLLRLWGSDHGLPYAYNSDENAHFVPRAIGIYGHEWNPDYFVNPPAYTYVLHIVFTVWFGGREGVSRLFATDPTEVWVVARDGLGGARHDGGRAALPRRGQALRPARGPAQRRGDRRSRSCRSSTRTWRSTTCRCSRRSASASGASRASCAPAARATSSSPAWASGLACATKYTAGIVLLPLLVAAGVQFAAPGGRVLAARGLVAQRRLRARRVRRRQPVRGARLRRLLGRHHPPVLGGGGGPGQARPGPRERVPLLPVVVHLGPGLGAAARGDRRRAAAVARRAAPGVAARARADPLRAVHGHAGALLRPLAAAGVPVRLHARRVRRRRGRRPRRASAGRRSSRRCWRSARSRCARRASSTRCTSARCSPARTRATSPASGSSTTCRRGRRSSSSRSCPTRGRRTSATRRG